MNRKDKVVNITFNAEMETNQIQQAVSEIKKEFEKVSFPEATSKRLLKDLQDLEEELQTLRATSSKIETFGDLEDSEKSLNKAKKLLNDLVASLTSIDQAGDFEKLIPKDFVDKIKAANKAYSDFNKETKNSLTNFNKTKKGLKELIEAHEELAKIQGTDGSKEKARNRVNEISQELSDESKELDKLLKQQRDLNYIRNKKASKKTSQEEIDEAQEQYDEVTKAISEQQLKIKDLNSTFKGYQNTLNKITRAEAEYTSRIEANGSAYKEYGETVEDLKRSLVALSDKGASPEQIKKLSDTLKAIDEDSFKDLKDDLSNIEELLGNMSVSAAEEVGEAIKNVTSNLNNAEEEADGLSKKLGGSKGAAEAAQKLKDEIGAVKNQMLDFFSIGNAIRIFEKAVDRAFQSVKELDAAMTETAVVTDFSVGDMWEALPEYASIARELGTTTLDVYEATTLLYQQGLQTNEVMEAGTEILKFARIAGLDAADATNFMTAAIRGFNMEMNEVNTKRVNDVYSELAAITASDTEQISVAVSKTASLAKNAGMELETTAAMLAQVIETTQEAPETAGTALKTIIARFQELKKDPLEMEEIDGEVVDANKIEAALRSVGVALRDTTGQFRDLDDVFLELSSKWNTLDKNQQRYIATVAAGSRRNDSCPLHSAA